MSEQQQSFTLEDVQAAWFAYGIDQCLGPGDTPEWYIRQTLPDFPGLPPRLPKFLAQYRRGAKVLARAELVRCRVANEVAHQHYEQLGRVDSPVWFDNAARPRSLIALRLHQEDRDSN